jgi:hypothetical protein
MIHPFLLMLSGLLLPIALVATLILPVYSAVFIALLIIYNGQTSALMDAALDVFYIQSVFEQAFAYWLDNYDQVSLLTYSLPITLLPLMGAAISLWATRRLAIKSAIFFRDAT